MSDLDHLRARLARLGDPPEPVSGQFRVLLSDRSPDILITLLREIRETHLARTVTFSNDRAENIVLNVKAGRSAMLIAAPNDPSVLMDIIGQPLSGADQAQKNTFCLILRKFVQGSAALSVQSSLTAPDISPAVIGICPKDCFSSSSPDDNQVVDAISRPNMHEFLDLCRDIAISLIWVRGAEIKDKQGEAAILLKLSVLAQDEIGKETTLSVSATPDPEQDMCVIICSCGISGEAILSGRSGDTMAFISFPAGNIAEVLSAWRISSMPDED